MKNGTILFTILAVFVSAFSAHGAQIDRNITASSSITVNGLNQHVLPKIRLGLTNLLENEYKCQNVKVNTSLDIGMYFHDVHVSIKADCPPTVGDLGINFRM